MANLLDNISSVYLIYFFYGGAFLFLGLSIAMKDTRASDLKLARYLWLLGMFGLTHGVHEWLQLYPLIMGEELAADEFYKVRGVSLVFFVASYLFLFQFGSSMIRSSRSPQTKWLSLLPPVLPVLWVGYIMIHGFTMDLQFLRQASIGARYTFGVAGSALAAYGLFLYSREITQLSGTVSRKLRNAGITFGFYGLVAGVFSSDISQMLLPVPVEILRGLAAVLITYFIIKALNIFDIEMRKKVEQQARRIIQAEKLTSLGQLAAGIAHEINNPLTNASLGLQTLKARLRNDGSGGPETIGKLEAVERNIDRAAAITRELLQFSRQQEADSVLLSVNTVLRGALTLLAYKLKGVDVREELSSVPEVRGDPGKLEQVFINILSNAVEAMPEGGSITVATSFDGSSVEVRVEDTGIGIPEENLSRVYDPFFTTKDVGAGTGLGLSICYGIVKQHNGSIELTSAAGRGTTVAIRLPAGGVA